LLLYEEKISIAPASRGKENKWQAAAAETAFEASGEPAAGAARKCRTV